MNIRAGVTILFVLLLSMATPSHATDTVLADTPETLFNTTDAQDLRDKATALSTPALIYQYVRNDFEYALYHGARSNAINTFLGQRGNDVDLATTLIAMYRYRGIPARYVVGSIQVKAADIQNWLGVHNLDLAVGILNDQGIQGVIKATDNSYVQFEHVWMEASVPFGDYRGAGPGSTSVNCTTTPSRCAWVGLDPSFKLKSYPAAPIDIHNTVTFDYNLYYNAIKNNDESRKESNPLQIHERAILDYLHINQPGKGLSDVADVGKILTEEAGILPTSLPYQVVGTLRRYNSVTDHDTAENPDWRKHLTVTIDLNGTSLPAVSVSVSDLSTQRLILGYESTPSPAQVLRLNGVELMRVALNGTQLDGTGALVQLKSHYNLALDMEGRAKTDGSGQTDHHVKSYTGQIMGGMQLIGSGGESSNWGNVHKAASQLLTANQQYAIAYLYDAINKIYVPYIDANRNGIVDTGEIKLIDNSQAMQALTGGLLEVAMRQYLVEVRESLQRIDALGHTVSPIEGFAGIASSVYDADYYGDIPFSILPGGLLIDVKGLEILGSWRTNAAQQPSDKQFLLIGHMTSALEHEVWQNVTGFDAISTVRGIQMAMANGAALLNPIKNASTDTLPSLYSQFGYQSAPQTPFQFRSSTVFSSKPASWYLNPDDGFVHGFGILKQQVTSTTPNYRTVQLVNLSDKGWDSFVTAVDSLENNLLAGITQYGANCTVNSPGYSFGGEYHSGNCSTVKNALNAFWTANTGDDDSKFLDQNLGFVNTGHVYRDSAHPIDSVDSITVQTIRNELYLQNPAQFWTEFLVPNKQAYGPYYRFTVFVEQWHNVSDNALYGMLFGIQNNSTLAAGGYVDIGTVVTPSTPLSEGSAITPTYTNALFTSKHLIAQVNNDPVKTPSSTDPISTVTGNNYHDETDFFIKGRGLDYTFTRTYNSAQQTTSVDGILGIGWTHSYAMKLKSNDWGDCPDCSAGTGQGLRPENGNGITASISYIDERGGEHLYLVNETTKAVTSPHGEFDALSNNTPSAGFHTLTFRNGVKYVFQTTSGVLNTTPNITARLVSIQDPYGNVLNLTYNALGQLIQVRDNLNIASRTGLTFAYFTNGRLLSVSDWTTRKWQYSYDANGNLSFVLNPLNQKITYSYQNGGVGNGPHDLTGVILPTLRNGQNVQTAFQYYRNGRAFSQKNALGQGENLEYDLFRRRTSVTDPRGAVRAHTYDANGALTQLEEPDGGVLLFSNQSDGLRYQKYDAQGYTTNYSYRSDRSFNSASDNGGNVTREHDALTHDIDTDYGIYDQMAAVKDKNGHNRRLVYATTTNATACGGDIKGKLKESRADLNGQLDVLLAQYYYDSLGNPCVTREFIEAGNTSRFRQTDSYFDAVNLYPDYKVVHQSNDLTRPYLYIDYSYDSLGRLFSESLFLPDPNDSTLLFQTTSYQYDALDRVTKVTNPRGDIRETVYDANGQVYQEKDWHLQADGLSYVTRITATHQYDAADRRIATTDILGKTTNFAYDEAGNLIKITDANGHATQYEYDAMNHKTAVINGNGQRTETKYDLAGHAIAITNDNNETTKSQYDALGRLTKVISPLAYETRFQYDFNGNLTCLIDANALSNSGDPGHQPVNLQGCTETRVYDELNRLTQTKDAQGNSTVTDYDLLGNRTTLTDAASHITTFNYDDLGRMTQIIDPLIETPVDKIQVFTYDQASNLLTKTDRKGQVTQYTYDRLNRNTQTLHLVDNSTESTTYDAYGDLIGTQNGAITYTYAYTDKHQLQSKTDSRLNKAESWTYDPVGNIQTKTDYQGDLTTYQYDSANRMTAETNSAYLQVGYHYDDAGRLLDRILSNGAKTHYGWDNGGRLTKLQNTSSTGQTVNNNTYTRDRIGNILTDSNSVGSTTTAYSYDPEYRLLSADYTGTANDEAFSYDKVGNRKISTKGALTPIASSRYYNYNAGNRMTDIRIGSATGTVYESYGYDDNGSLIGITGNRTMTLTWDANNRPGQINANTFNYDPAGYRIKKAGSTNSNYYLQGEHLEAIYDNTGIVQAQYFRGSIIDEIVNGYQKDSNGKLVNTTYHHDALQSVLGQSGHEGSILATQSYSAFGSILSQTGSSNNAQKYTGREIDNETGFYYYRARYYDVVMGRFISQDPKGFGAGINFYAYAENNPINFNDPTGFVRYGDALTSGLGVLSSVAGSVVGVAGISGGGALLAAPDPTLLTKIAGIGTISYGSALLANSSGNFALSAQNFVSALRDQPAGVPGSLAEGFAGIVAPGSVNAQLAATAFNLTLDLASGRVPVGLIPTNVGSALSGFKFANFSELNNYNTSANAIGGLPISVGAPGVAASTFFSDILQVSSTFQTAFSISPTISDNLTGSANGGFVLYPNKSNTNMMQSVYKK